MNPASSSDRAFPGLCRKLCRKLADSTKVPAKVATMFSQWPFAFTKPVWQILLVNKSLVSAAGPRHSEEATANA